MVLVSLVDEHRQWFKSRVGIDVEQAPRKHAFCAHAIAGEGTMVVPDARDDVRFRDNPLVLGEPHIRFYAGAPLESSAGALGTLCVIDTKPRRLTADEQQALEDLACIVTETLHLRRAAEVAERNAQVLELAEKLADLGHWHYDPQDQHVFWSPQVKRIHGLASNAPHPSLQEAIASYHPDDRPRVKELVGRAMREHAPFDFEARLVRGDGEVRLVRAVGVPDEDGPQGASGVFGVFHDLTDQRRAAERLHQTQKMASLGTLAAGVAHEVNNPLSYIVANAQALRRELADGEQSAMVADIEEGAERVRRIVGELKAFSRSSQSQPGPVDVRAVLEAAVRIARPELRRHGKVVVDAVSELPPAYGDEAQLVQVAVNLLVNAAHASKGDPSRHVVSVLAGVSAGNVYFEVVDNGIGMTADVQEQAFWPFFTTKGRDQGTGLGLSISQEIVQSFGGEITVRSTVGEGTTFRVVLPLGGSTPPQASSVPPSSGAAGRLRLLIVDDEPAVGRGLRRLLRDHDVTVETDPYAALERLRAQAFDVVLCDLMMPGLSGRDVYRAIREQDPELAARVTMMTGGALGEELQRFLDEEAPRVLYKPVDGKTIRDVLRELGPREAPSSDDG